MTKPIQGLVHNKKTMQIRIPQGQPLPRYRLIIDSAKGGTVTNIDEARQNIHQSPETVNLTLEQDGLWTTRPGTVYYGSIPGEEESILGGAEYVVDEDTRELIVVGGSGKVYKSENDGKTWSEITGATMTQEKRCYFLQIDNNLYITNRTDRLTLYNGSVLIRNSPIDNPSNLTATRGGGLSSGSFNLYYRVVALNEVGFTAGSNEANVTVNKQRDTWATETEKIDLSWDAVSGATRYEIYIADESGALIYLADSTTNSYADTGAAQVNPYREIPDVNTTGGPILGRLSLSNGRIWGVDENFNVVFSGVSQYINYFSWFYGGGWSELDPGGREFPIVVVHYRTGKGDVAPTVLSKSPDGRGSIWQIAMDTLTIGEDIVIIPTPVKIVGSIGAQGESAVTDANDNIYSANKKGVYALRNKAQMFNVLATDEQSVNIRPSYRKQISGKKFEDIITFFSEGKVMISASQDGVKNDTTFLHDLEKNAWIWAWTIGFEQFFEYTDANSQTHLLGVQKEENKLIEISERTTLDKGQGFRTSWKSPLLHVDPKDKTLFAKVKDVVLEIGRPQGTINFEILGIMKNKPLRQLGSRTIGDTVSSVDFCNALFGDYEFGTDPEVPTVFAQASVKKRIKINKKLNAIQFRVSSSVAGTRYTLLSLTAKGRFVPTKPPGSWNN